MRVALYTFGIFSEPAMSPANQGFHDRNDLNLAAVEQSEGFIARSGYAGDPGPDSWGLQVYPRFYVERGDGWSPSTLSLWSDLESPLAFTYAGIHAEALKPAREWFELRCWPGYVLWWVADSHVPQWDEAIIRHEHLHDHGASPFAFTFKESFDPSGQGVMISRESMKEKIRLNAERQARLLRQFPKQGEGRSS